jgi:hypothetical protein
MYLMARILPDDKAHVSAAADLEADAVPGAEAVCGHATRRDACLSLFAQVIPAAYLRRVWDSNPR